MAGASADGEGVAWLGLSAGAGRLIETATLTAERCPPEVTHGRPPRRTPSAHLTVVRKAHEGAIEALRAAGTWPAGSELERGHASSSCAAISSPVARATRRCTEHDVGSA